MNKLFKDIRHSDVDAVRVAISKNITVVNEVYTAKAPKKDIGQSPLQVAIKCGEFEIIIEKHHQKYCQSVRLYTKQRAFCATRVLTQIFKK